MQSANNNKILSMSSLQGERMKVHIPEAMTKVRGFISGVPLSMSVEDVKNEIQGGQVVEATRLKSKQDGSLKETLCVVMHFEKTLPNSVQMAYMNYSVREYIPKPLRCYKCQKLGTQHSSAKESLGVLDVEVSMSMVNVKRMQRLNAVTVKESIWRM